MAIIHLTSENFDQEVLSSEQPVLVDFWAEWCGPCRMLTPILEEAELEIAEKNHGKVCKVNVDEQPELAAKFGVMSIPTLVLLNKGEEVNREVGLCQKEEIQAMFSQPTAEKQI